MIGAAASHLEIRWPVIRGRNLDHRTRRCMIVATSDSQTGEDQIRVALATISVLITVNDIEIAGSCGLDANANLLALVQRRICCNALRRPRASVLILLN